MCFAPEESQQEDGSSSSRTAPATTTPTEEANQTTELESAVAETASRVSGQAEAVTTNQHQAVVPVSGPTARISLQAEEAKFSD